MGHVGQKIQILPSILCGEQSILSLHRRSLKLILNHWKAGRCDNLVLQPTPDSQLPQAIFVTQVLMVIGYCAALATFPEYWWTCTLLFGLPFSYIAIQQMLVSHCMFNFH